MSNPICSERYLALLREFEGFSHVPYLCTAGRVTIGFGTNLEAHPKHIPYPCIRDQVEKGRLSGARLLAALRTSGGMTWDRIEADAAMLDELALVHADLQKRCPAYVALLQHGEAVRAEALLDMGYNMGVGRAPTRKVRGLGLLSFTGTLPLIERGCYEEAAERLTYSLWFEQVGRRARAVRYMMQTGRYPEDLR